MKIERFLDKISGLILNNNSIDIQTVKLILTEFNNCLSKKEKEMYHIKLGTLLITEKTTPTLEHYSLYLSEKSK